MADLRVYVACLASYNNGVLYGEWIDVSDDVEEMQEEINEILRRSPYPNILRQEFGCDDCGETWQVQVGICTPTSKGLLKHIEKHGTTCPHCGEVAEAKGEPYPTAEEWAFHDNEGFAPFNIGEYPSLASLAEMYEGAEKAEEMGEQALYFHLRAGGFDHGEAIEMLDNYSGCYKNLGDWAHELEEDTGGLENVPEHLRNYIDWDAVGRDAEVNGDIHTVETGFESIHVFWNR